MLGRSLWELTKEASPSEGGRLGPHGPEMFRTLISRYLSGRCVLACLSSCLAAYVPIRLQYSPSHDSCDRLLFNPSVVLASYQAHDVFFQRGYGLKALLLPLEVLAAHLCNAAADALLHALQFVTISGVQLEGAGIGSTDARQGGQHIRVGGGDASRHDQTSHYAGLSLRPFTRPILYFYISLGLSP